MMNNTVAYYSKVTNLTVPPLPTAHLGPTLEIDLKRRYVWLIHLGHGFTCRLSRCVYKGPTFFRSISPHPS